MALSGFDVNERPLSHEVAHNKINAIRALHGHINDDDRLELSRTSARLSDQYYMLAKKMREESAKFTKTISEQIYTSKFRFIYELIQNADDAEYRPDVVPTITFRVFPSCLTMQSNEIGFTLPNVEAICATGRSSKVENSDTTGEKGFGFKSVFGISNHVRVESGYWSFAFSYGASDDGLGMVTPEWVEPESSFPREGTRFVLQFTDNREHFVQTLLTKMKELPKTIVFGLRRLKQVVICFEDVNGQSGQIAFRRDTALTADRMQITTVASGCLGSTQPTKSAFRIFRETATNLPKHELRRSDSSVVTIAFEVTDDNIPVIPSEGQHVFAYLPVQRVANLPFIINADFVLLASRQEIPENDWNDALCSHVTTTFCAAVIHICHASTTIHPDPLENFWMRYLPQNPLPAPWNFLTHSIKKALTYVPVLKSQSNEYRTVSQLRIVPTWFLHDQRPLLQDVSPSVYLSQDYTPADGNLVRKLGLQDMTPREALERVKLDLEDPLTSDLQSKSLEDDWHTTFTNFILDKLCTDSTTKSHVATLEIIPLSDDQWVSKASMRDSDSYVYRPYLVEESSVVLRVPTQVGIKSLHHQAYAVAERLALYTHLGVGSCSPKFVLKKVFDAHRSSVHRPLQVHKYLQELEILFWYWNPSDVSFNVRNPPLKAVDDRYVCRAVSNLFLPSTEKHHAQELLSHASKEDIQAFGFLHPMYMQSQVRETIRFDKDWRTWLQDRGMSYIPRLVSPTNKNKVSPEMSLIAKVNPDMFLSTLHAHWKVYEPDSSLVGDEIGDLVLPCEGGHKVSLRSSFLPTKTCTEVAEQVGMTTEVPFLKLPAEELPIQLENWSFLEKFQVKCSVNIAFYLHLLQILKQKTLTVSLDVLKVCTTIYTGLAACSTMADTQILQDKLHESELIYVTAGAHWRSPNRCVWEGPGALSQLSVLSDVYGSKSTGPATLFQKILGIRNANEEDIVAELRLLSGSNTAINESHRIVSMYSALSEMMTKSENIETIRYGEYRSLNYATNEDRSHFVKEPLIWVKDQHWLKISDALWNCTVEISGKVPLDEVYPGLQDFFVGKLRVKTINSDILAIELAKCSGLAVPDVGEIKRIMVGLGKLLAADSNTRIRHETLTKLKTAAFLPIKEKDALQLRKVTDEFCINDHKRYAEAFSGKLNMLDFGYDSHMVLHPFIKALGLEHCYLSHLVDSATTVDESLEDEGLTLHFRQRAYALSCCAIKKHSRLYFGANTTTHQLLLNAEVFICDQMWTELTVEEQGQGVTVKSDRAVVKITKTPKQLQLYVPSNESGLLSCYCTELPAALAAVLGIEDESATKVVYRILNDTTDLGSIMKDEDLTECPWIENPYLGLPSNLPYSESGPALDTQPATAPRIQVNISSGPQETDDINSPRQLSFAAPAPAPALQAPVSVPGPSVPIPIWQRAARDQQYKRLLQEVVRQAKYATDPRTSGRWSMTEIMQALDDTDVSVDYQSLQNTFGYNSGAGFEENARIGAAGELFIFQRLKALGVSAFNRDNWQSRIRHHAACLPEFSTLQAWDGPEISDIMYTGDCNILREFLRNSTSQHYPPWLDDRASFKNTQFHLEVKTTTGPCRTPFFVSKNQYKLMRDRVHPADQKEQPDHVYVILRVYNLLTSRIGLDVYINPWHLRDNVLEFVADPWKVIPPDPE